MRGIFKAGVVVGIISWAGIAGAAAKQAVSLDDLFAAVDKAKPSKGSKASKVSKPAAHASNHASSKAKVVKGEGRASKIKAPLRAAAAPAEAPATTQGGAATPEQEGLVLAEFAPNRHALAGP